jgi:hypothetical protein
MRTKAEVLMEHYGVADYMKVMDLQMEDHDSYLWHLPLDQWTKLKLPYEAPEHPGIPSMEEIERGMRESQYFTLLPVCKAGNCFVKIGADRIIVQVSFSTPNFRVSTN